MGPKTGSRSAAVIAVLFLLVVLPAGLGGSNASGQAVPRANATTSLARAGLLGDVDCSGSIDVVDALQVLRSVAGLPVAGGCLSAGDTDCSGNIEAVDSLRILRFVAGLSVASPPGCGTVGGAVLSSEELIDKALAEGKIKEDTALIYRVFAAFGDSRLPSEYRGAPGNDSNALALAAIQFDSLPSEAQSTLAPFLLPPSAPGSWLELPSVPQGQSMQAAPAVEEPITWKTYPAAGGTVKVWAQDRYPGDDAKAQALAEAMTNTIWPIIIDLVTLQHAPFTDAKLPNNGGDGALDIYLVHIGDAGVAVPADPKRGCQLYSTYLLVDSRPPLGSETSSGLLQNATHEFFHAVEATFPLKTGCWYPEYAWAEEGTATWAEEYVYPLAQSEHRFAWYQVNQADESLDSDWLQHQYGTYVMDLYMARYLGKAGLVKSLWDAFANSGSFAALNEVLPGGVKDSWPDFALREWNRPPVDNFMKLDDLDEQAMAEVDQDLPEGSVLIKTTIDHLAAKYYDLRFPEGARAVKFENPGLPPEADIRALVNIGGQWQAPADWTKEATKNYCRDLPAQDIQELVLVVSNTDWQGKKQITVDGPKVTASPTGCTAWEGWAKTTMTTRWSVGKASTEGIHFEWDPYSEEIPGDEFWTTRGTVNWTFEGTSGNCTESGSGNFSVANHEGSIHLTDPDPSGTILYYGAGGRPPADPAPTVTFYCPDVPPFEGYPDFTFIWLEASVMNLHEVTDDGHLRGTDSQDYGGGDVQTWEWDFAPAP